MAAFGSDVWKSPAPTGSTFSKCIAAIPSNDPDREALACVCIEDSTGLEDPRKAPPSVLERCRAQQPRRGAPSAAQPPASPSNTRTSLLDQTPEEDQVIVRTDLGTYVNMRERGLPVERVPTPGGVLLPKTKMVYDPVLKEYDIRSHPEIGKWGVQLAQLGWVPDYVAQNMDAIQGASRQRCKKLADFDIRQHPQFSQYISKEEHERVKASLQQCQNAFDSPGFCESPLQRPTPAPTSTLFSVTSNARPNGPVVSPSNIQAAAAAFATAGRREGFANPPQALAAVPPFPCAPQDPYCIQFHKQRPAYEEHVLNTRCKRLADYEDLSGHPLVQSGAYVKKSECFSRERIEKEIRAEWETERLRLQAELQSARQVAASRVAPAPSVSASTPSATAATPATSSVPAVGFPAPVPSTRVPSRSPVVYQGSVGAPGVSPLDVSCRVEGFSNPTVAARAPAPQAVAQALSELQSDIDSCLAAPPMSIVPAVLPPGSCTHGEDLLGEERAKFEHLLGRYRRLLLVLASQERFLSRFHDELERLRESMGQLQKHVEQPIGAAGVAIQGLSDQLQRRGQIALEFPSEQSSCALERDRALREGFRAAAATGWPIARSPLPTCSLDRPTVHSYPPPVACRPSRLQASVCEKTF